MDQKGFIAMTPYSEQVERDIGELQRCLSTAAAELREMACLAVGVGILLAASIWGAAP